MAEQSNDSSSRQPPRKISKAAEVELRESLIVEIRDRLEHDVEAMLREAGLRIEKDTENAFRQVGDTAIDKTLKIVAETRLWMLGILGLLFTVAAGVGFFGFKELYAQSMQKVENKVESWLSVGSSDSPVRTSLERLRTRAILDAYLIRAVRSKEVEGFQGRSPSLSADDRKRLYVAIKDPTTPDPEFQDAARLIALSLGFESSIFPDPDMEEAAKVVFGGKEYSNEKKTLLLTAWSRERAMEPVAEAILNKTDSPLAWKQYAFDTLAHTAAPEAAKYARSTLPTVTDTRLAEDMAGFLLGQTVRDSTATAWLSRPDTPKLEGYPVIIAGIASKMAAAIGNGPDKHLEVEEASSLLRRAVESGARLRVERENFSGNDIFFSYTKGATIYYRQLLDVQKFLQQNEVLTSVLVDAGNNIVKLKMFIDRLQLTRGEHDVAVITAKLGAGGNIRLAEGQGLSSQETEEPVLLRAIQRDGNIHLLANWRAKNGMYHRAEVVGIDQGAKIRYEYAFDQDAAGRLEMQRLRQYFHD